MIAHFSTLELHVGNPIADRVQEIGKALGAFREGDFVLSSGHKSSYYFDGKMITLSPEGAYLVGKLVFEIVRKAHVDAIGGLTIGADPIVTAVAVVSHLEGSPLPAFIVRTEPKKHGTQKWVEGHLPPKGGRVAIVDDVITKGTSVFKAIEAVEREGCQVVKVVVLVDRCEGGSEELRRRGYDFEALYTYSAPGKVELTIGR